MLEHTITEDEIEFMECFVDPICLSECLFSDYDSLGVIDERLAHLRFGQLSMISYEYLIDEDPRLSLKENFKLLEGAGSIYNFGARKYGKSLISLIIDIILSAIHLSSYSAIFTSYDAVHIRKILETIIATVDEHPFLKPFKKNFVKSPTYFLQFKTGFNLESVNMNVMSKAPGNQFFGHHVKKMFIEEASKETNVVREKRLDAISEVGCIERVSGMTDFTKYSPAGQVYYDFEKKPWLVNYPQYVSPMWDEKEKTKACKKYNGESSIVYRVFVKGEVVEEGISVFDMERVRKNYLEDKFVKAFEINKDNFHIFEHLLIVERPSNAEYCFICSDIGESAPSEIIIMFEINKKYHYSYNITLYNLTDEQQREIFSWLGKKVEANIIALDCTDGTGRAIYRALEQELGKQHLCWVAFNEKIPVDLERTESGALIMKDSKPVEKEEFAIEWSVKHLKDLFYDERMSLPIDYKFDSQINSVVATPTTSRITYTCVSEEDHLFQSFQVFSVAHWLVEFKNIKPINRKKFSKVGV